MSEQWYYVEKGERQGPVDLDVIVSLYQSGTLKNIDFVWIKGFENWTKIEEVEQIQAALGSQPSIETDLPSAMPPMPEALEDLSFSSLINDEKCLFIKVGADRGEGTNEYGPYSLEMMKKLYTENRVNGKTLIFKAGTSGWIPMGEVQGFQEAFEDMPPVIEDVDRRSAERKPFVARMLFTSNNNVFEGICRDISTGGMQVLVSDFPGSLGDKISLNVHPENTLHHFVASGEIVRLLEGGQGFSFQFIDLGEDAITAIKNYMDE